MFELDALVDTPPEGLLWYDNETDRFLIFDGEWIVLHPDEVYQMLLNEAMRSI